MLSDSGKRKQYDNFGTATDFPGAESPTGNWNTSWNFRSSVDPEEFFRQIFNRDINDSEFNEFDPLGGSQRGFNRTKEVSEFCKDLLLSLQRTTERSPLF